MLKSSFLITYPSAGVNMYVEECYIVSNKGKNTYKLDECV